MQEKFPEHKNHQTSVLYGRGLEECVVWGLKLGEHGLKITPTVYVQSFDILHVEAPDDRLNFVLCFVIRYFEIFIESSVVWSPTTITDINLTLKHTTMMNKTPLVLLALINEFGIDSACKLFIIDMFEHVHAFVKASKKKFKYHKYIDVCIHNPHANADTLAAKMLIDYRDTIPDMCIQQSWC